MRGTVDPRDCRVLRDVLNTNRDWLRYEVFRGRLSDVGFQASEDALIDFIKARGKPRSIELWLNSIANPTKRE
jgi:hypothetical protein